MSFFDPHHVYDKKKRKSHKGQIIQKRLGTRLIPPMSREELARVEHYLLTNGLVTKDRQYSKTVHKTYQENGFNIPDTGFIIFHFGTIYNRIFKDEFEWKIEPTGTNQPKSFEVMVALNRIEYTYLNDLPNDVSGSVSYIPDRTNEQSYLRIQFPKNRPLTYTPQDVSFCQLQVYTGTWYPNFTTVNNYSYLISYHSYDINDYRKFALGSDLPIDEIFGVRMIQGSGANIGNGEFEFIISIKYTY